MALPQYVKVVEVGPRDGLQNEIKLIPTATKIEFINQLSETGLSVIEATSFVSAQWIPQLGDHTAVLQGIKKAPSIRYPVLVPNEKGFENALAAGATEIAIFTAVSETFAQKNINCHISESLQRFKKVADRAHQLNIPIRGYLSCTLGCPFEGEIKAEKTLEVAQALLDLGCYEISLADTIGIGTPNKALQVFETVAKKISLQQLAGHFHNTYGQALANIYALLQIGVAAFDSSISGLGGCPYAKGATGNVATEDVLYLLHGLNIETKIDLDKMIEVSRFISTALKKSTDSKVTRAKIGSK